MRSSNALVILDPDTPRRAAIAREISKENYHVEPYESILELDHWWNDQSILMIHDSEQLVSSVASMMKDKGIFQPIIAYSHRPSIDRIVAAVLAGALDYCEWPFQGQELNSRLETVNRRFAEFSGQTLTSNQAKKRIECLTGRELEVLSLLAGGRTNRIIADGLNISPRTVEVHRANMMNKLNVKHVAEAIRAAIDANVVTPKDVQKVINNKRAA